MASRHPSSRVSKSPHKQYTIPITTPRCEGTQFSNSHTPYSFLRERHSKYDVKPPMGVHTHPRPSSAKIRSAIEKCDILQQDLEKDKQFIVHLSVDVIQTKEEYKQSCAEFGKMEDWHRIVGLSVMVNDIQRQFTELERKLANYNAENSKIRDNNNELKRRLMQLDGRCVVMVEKRKVIKEQLKTPKNLMKRAKVQSVTISPLRDTDLELNRRVELVKAEKSDIQAQFNQCQSELDNLIKTERRLKENINRLQASHNTVKQDIQKLKEKEKTARSSRKHKKEVQKTAVYCNNPEHTLQPSQSSNKLEALENEARAHQKRELYRTNLEIELQQHKAELQQLSKEKESLEKRIVDLQNDAIKRNDKFREQLVQTAAEQQVETKWIDCIKEKDKRITELEKAISDVNSAAINHQSLLRSIVAQKDSELEACQQSLNKKSTELLNAKGKEADLIREVKEVKHQVEELKNDCTKLEKAFQEKDLELTETKKCFKEKDLELTKTKKFLETAIAQKSEELKFLQRRSEKISNDSESKLNKVDENYRSIVAQKDSQLEACQQRLKESSQQLTEAKDDVKLLQTAVSAKHSNLENCHINLKKKSTELHTAKEEFKLKEADLIRQVEELKRQVEEQKNSYKKLEKDFQGKDLELTETKKRCEFLHTTMAQKNEELTDLKRRREKSTSPLSKQDDRSIKNHENIPKKLLIEKLNETEQELKKYQESLLKHEEKSFKFTNAFTSAGEGSVLDMSKRYRHLQHNKRAAAARALKKAHKIDARDHLCNQIMNAYETAKSVVLDEARRCIDINLFELQTDEGMISHNKELLQGCMVLLSCIQENVKIKNTAINQIKITLDQAYKKMDVNPLPSEVEDYYQSLAELVWCAVARPIPMIIAKLPDTYHKCYHELKDGEDVEDGSAVSYIYPVLYSSNECPRQVAQEGRVILKQHL